jgi:hypothetical protein
MKNICAGINKFKESLMSLQAERKDSSALKKNSKIGNKNLRRNLLRL